VRVRAGDAPKHRRTPAAPERRPAAAPAKPAGAAARRSGSAPARERRRPAAAPAKPAGAAARRSGSAPAKPAAAPAKPAARRGRSAPARGGGPAPCFRCGNTVSVKPRSYLGLQRLVCNACVSYLQRYGQERDPALQRLSDERQALRSSTCSYPGCPNVETAGVRWFIHLCGTHSRARFPESGSRRRASR